MGAILPTSLAIKDTKYCAIQHAKKSVLFKLLMSGDVAVFAKHNSPSKQLPWGLGSSIPKTTAPKIMKMCEHKQTNKTPKPSAWVFVEVFAFIN